MTPDSVLKQWIEQEQRIKARLQPPGVIAPAVLGSMSGAQLFQAIHRGELPSIWIGETLNFVPIEITDEQAVFQGQPQTAHLNPLGSIHGGWYCTLLDSALGCCIHQRLPAGKGYTTLELKVNMTRALSPKVERVRAIGKVIHLGGQVATSEASLVGPDGKLYGHATSTCLVFPMPA
jgi:uncharacterized protein (TIGR00369 family)